MGREIAAWVRRGANWGLLLVWVVAWYWLHWPIVDRYWCGFLALTLLWKGPAERRAVWEDLRSMPEVLSSVSAEPRAKQVEAVAQVLRSVYCYLTFYGFQGIWLYGQMLFWKPLVTIRYVVGSLAELGETSARLVVPFVVGFVLHMFVGWQVLTVLTHLAFHRHFSHRSFSCGRGVSFGLAVLASVGGQGGALWWAATHRQHHQKCDVAGDVHSPALSGVLYSHCGWMLDRENFRVRVDMVPALVHREELWVLETMAPLLHPLVIFLFQALSRGVVWVVAGLLFSIDLFSGAVGPGLASVTQEFLGMATLVDEVWEENAMTNCAAIVGCALFYHFVFFTNSLCHTHGADGEGCAPRDVYWVGCLNGGEGFHADHHAEPQVARHGPVDAVYAAICALERIGLVYDVQHPKGATKPSIRIDDVQDMGKATKSSKRRVQS